MIVYFFFHQWGTRSKSHMPTWFKKWETKKRKFKNIKPPPCAHVLDPTQKKPKGVGILGKGFKKEKKPRGKVVEQWTNLAHETHCSPTTSSFPQQALWFNSARETPCA
jgi:hypothetical protein